MSATHDSAQAGLSRDAAATHPLRRRVSAFLFPLAVLGMVAALVLAFVVDWSAWVSGRIDQTTDDAYLQADLTPIAAKVAGYVRAVPVRDFQIVRSGDLLVQILDDDYAAQVAQAEANVAVAKAAIDNYESEKALQAANIAAAEAVALATRAQLVRNDLEAKRQRSLLQTGLAGTRQAVEQADAANSATAATLQQNVAQIEAAKRQLGVIATQQKQARATLEVQQAALSLARINLGYTRIIAPRDGEVGQRQVQVGQYVGPGTQVFSLVPLPHVWVVANYKETQMNRVRLGQRALVTVDAFPGAVLHGHVDSWSPASGSQFSLLPPDNATGNFTKVVQRIPVKIVLDSDNGPTDLLRPGMSVIATIHTDTQGGTTHASRSP